MPSVYSIEIGSEDDAEGLFVWPDQYYVLADGYELKVLKCAAWCRKCEAFVIAEFLPYIWNIRIVVADFKKAPEKLENWRVRFFGNCLSVDFDDEEEWRHREIWRTARRQGPVCLHCASRDIIPLPLEQSVRHPAGDQLITITYGGGIGSGSWRACFYSPEGELIAVGMRGVKSLKPPVSAV